MAGCSDPGKNSRKPPSFENDAEFSRCASHRLADGKDALAQRSVFRWQLAFLRLAQGTSGKVSVILVAASGVVHRCGVK